MFETKNTLCWSCRNAVPDEKHGCSWNERLEPVPGWKTKKGGNKEYITECVLECPEFVPDHPGGGAYGR